MSRGILYNPSFLSREEILKGFIVRHEELRVLGEAVRRSSSGSVQHFLVIGRRGMGKTTLLHRLGITIAEQDDLSADWVPVLFDEEQFNLGDLADFWLNTMTAMISSEASEARKKIEAEWGHSNSKLEEACRNWLQQWVAREGKSLVLLVDNIDRLFGQLPEQDSRILRGILQHETWIMLIGASARAVEVAYTYNEPFYEMFQLLELPPLSDEESIKLLEGLDAIDSSRPRSQMDHLRNLIKPIRMLAGGNPRSLALFYSLVRDGPIRSFREELERLLDEHTPYYKAQMEALSGQSQRVFDALAQAWEPVSAMTVAETLRLERAVVGGQLSRLEKQGMVSRAQFPGERAVRYQVRERFFNIWCLMRGARRGRNRLRWLAMWIEVFYDDQGRKELGSALLKDLMRTRDKGAMVEVLEHLYLVTESDVLRQLLEQSEHVDPTFLAPLVYMSQLDVPTFIESTRELVAELPINQSINIFLDVMSVAMGDPEALTRLRSELARPAEYFEEHMMVALGQMTVGDADEAFRLLNSVAGNFPDRVDEIHAFLDMLTNLEQHNELNHVAPLLNKLSSGSQIGESDLADLRAMAASNSLYIQPLALGIIASGDYKQIEELEIPVVQPPVAALFVGLVYALAGRAELAQQFFDQVDGMPLQPDVLQLLASAVRLGFDQPDLAIAELRTITESYCVPSHLQVVRAHLFLQQNRGQEAIAVVAELGDVDVTLWFRAIVAVQEQQFDEALRYVRQLSLPRGEQTYLMELEALRKLDRASEAIAIVEGIREHFPLSGQLTNAHAVLLLQNARWDSFLQMASDIREVATRDFFKSIAFLGLGKSEELVDLFIESCSKWSPDEIWDIGMGLSTMVLPESSLMKIRLVLEDQHPDHDDLSFLLLMIVFDYKLGRSGPAYTSATELLRGVDENWIQANAGRVIYMLKVLARQSPAEVYELIKDADQVELFQPIVYALRVMMGEPLSSIPIPPEMSEIVETVVTEFRSEEE